MSNLTRFRMTDPPEVGGQPGDYEERWAQWFLEQSFFRDFIYRNPHGKRYLLNKAGVEAETETGC